MKLKNNFSPFSLFGLLCMLVLMGCVSTPQKYGVSSPIIRTLKLTGPDAAFLKEAKLTLDAHPQLQTTTEEETAEFTLILHPINRVKNTAIFNEKPRIIGRLEKRNKTQQNALQYTLLNFNGSVIQMAEVVGVGKEETGYFPSLTPPSALNLDTETFKDTLTRLQEEILQTIQQTPFEAPVQIVHPELKQVAIPTYNNQGFNKENLFHTKTNPSTALRFVGFVTVLGVDTQLALLSLEEGPLPQLGDVIILKIQK